MPKSVVIASFLDREGNTWLSTPNGVERLRAQRIHEVAIPDSVFAPYVFQGLDNAIWVAGRSSHVIFRATTTSTVPESKVADIQVAWQENADSIWAGSMSTLFHMTHAGIKSWPRHGTIGAIQAIAVDRAGVVWVSITRQGLFRFDAGEWTQVDTSIIGDDAIPITLLPSTSGKVWLGFTNGRIGELVNGVVRALPSSSSQLGNVMSLVEVDGRLIAGGEQGLAWVGNGGSHILP